MSTLRADQITPGMRVRRTRAATGAVDVLTVSAVRRQHEGGVTRYGFDTSTITNPRGDFLGWFTPGAAIHTED